MFVFVVPAVLAGLLGLLANDAGDAAAYLARLRFAMLGSVALGYLGVAVFLLRKTVGWKRWAGIVWALLAVRVAYAPILGSGLVISSWLEWAARLLGAKRLAVPVHYMLPCFWCMIAGLWSLLAVAAFTRVKQIGWAIITLIVVGLGVLSMWKPGDRAVSPHAFEENAPGPATVGPSYLDVAEDSRRDTVTRILAVAGVARHALQSRRGWSAVVRQELVARYRGTPTMTLRDRISCLEAAMVRARSTLSSPDPAPTPDPN
ncbi:MAG: hypothetical protein OER88_14775 [Planctomycetota bacterium]|nr:hypothetical protein [Planctomycetota bacterium]